MCTLWLLTIMCCIGLIRTLLKVVSWYQKTRVVFSLCSIHNIGNEDSVQTYVLMRETHACIICSGECEIVELSYLCE